MTETVPRNRAGSGFETVAGEGPRLAPAAGGRGMATFVTGGPD